MLVLLQTDRCGKKRKISKLRYYTFCRDRNELGEPPCFGGAWDVAGSKRVRDHVCQACRRDAENSEEHCSTHKHRYSQFISMNA